MHLNQVNGYRLSPQQERVRQLLRSGNAALRVDGQIRIIGPVRINCSRQQLKGSLKSSRSSEQGSCRGQAELVYRLFSTPCGQSWTSSTGGDLVEASGKYTSSRWLMAEIGRIERMGCNAAWPNSMNMSMYSF